MNKARAFIIVAFLVVFAAGAVVGMVRGHRLPPAGEPGPFRELDLSDAQREQMKGIWSSVANLHHQIDDQRHQLDRQREDSVRALLTPDQQAKYDQIVKQSREQADAIEQQMRKAVHDAEDRTRLILTPEQILKFDKIREEHESHMHRRPHDHPSTRPATGPREI